MKKISLFLTCAFFALLAGVAAINWRVISFSKPYIHSSLSELPQKYAVIIPGAKVYQNNVSHVVRDRLDAAANCLKTGKAQKALISGDHGRRGYDEVNQMRLYAQKVYGIKKNYFFGSRGLFHIRKHVPRAGYFLRQGRACGHSKIPRRPLRLHRKKVGP